MKPKFSVGQKVKVKGYTGVYEIKRVDTSVENEVHYDLYNPFDKRTKSASENLLIRDDDATKSGTEYSEKPMGLKKCPILAQDNKAVERIENHSFVSVHNGLLIKKRGDGDYYVMGTDDKIIADNFKEEWEAINWIESKTAPQDDVLANEPKSTSDSSKSIESKKMIDILGWK